MAVNATTRILQGAAAARLQLEDFPLIPHRIHLLARPTEGLVVCLNAACGEEGWRPLAGLGPVLAGQTDHCPHCHGATLGLVRCQVCGEVLLAGLLDGSVLRAACVGEVQPLPVSNGKRSDAQAGGVLLLTSTGNGAEGEAEPAAVPLLPTSAREEMVLEPGTGEVRGVDAPGVALLRTRECPRCLHGMDEEPPFRGFVTTNALTQAIVAESALMELPEYPSQENLWLPARGRRMLTFSDSRQEAARLGPRLTRQHQLQVLRAALVRCVLDGPAADDDLMEALRLDLESVEQELARPGLSPAHATLQGAQAGGTHQHLEQVPRWGEPSRTGRPQWRSNPACANSSTPRPPPATPCAPGPRRPGSRTVRRSRENIPGMLMEEIIRPRARGPVLPGIPRARGGHLSRAGSSRSPRRGPGASPQRCRARLLGEGLGSLPHLPV